MMIIIFYYLYLIYVLNEAKMFVFFQTYHLVIYICNVYKHILEKKIPQSKLCGLLTIAE